MDEKILLFFDKNMDALPLYERLEDRILSEIGDVSVKVQKTQISFSNRHMFSCVSFARVRKKKDCPGTYIVVTFGLGHKVESPRIDVATEPYPNRWTHHVLISELEEIDDELMGWIKEAGVFSAGKC
ncbi:MAG: DUF5655 domain-containing protein [Clostridium sp.]|nr:DUF5655 domain-containing protein [Clostridium sp.]